MGILRAHIGMGGSGEAAGAPRLELVTALSTLGDPGGK